MNIRKELEKQLKDPERKKDAEDCLKIYNKLSEISDGHVWSSDYHCLIKSTWVGKYPDTKFVQWPSKIGQIFINGIID